MDNDRVVVWLGRRMQLAISMGDWSRAERYGYMLDRVLGLR